MADDHFARRQLAHPLLSFSFGQRQCIGDAATDALLGRKCAPTCANETACSIFGRGRRACVPATPPLRGNFAGPFKAFARERLGIVH